MAGKLFLSILFITTMIPCLSVYGQKPALRHFDMQDKLPSNYSYRVYQDSRKFIWVCTAGGVSRYDGHKWQNFTTLNGLPYNDIQNFYEDDAQRLWLCNYSSHFCYIDLKTDSIYTIINTFTEDNFSYTNYYIQKDDTTIATSIFGNSYYYELHPKKGTIKKIIIPNSDFYPCYKEVSVKLLNSIFFDNSLIKKINNTHVLSKLPNSNYSTNLFCGYTKETLYISGSTFLKKMSLVNFKKKFGNLEKCSIFDNQYYLLQFEKQIIVMDTNFRIADKFNFFNTLDIHIAFTDSNHNYWLTSKQNGFYLLSNSAINTKQFNLSNSTFSNKITCITSTPNSIIFATTNGTIYEKNKNIIRPIFKLKSKGYIRDITFHKQSNKLVFITNESNISAGFLHRSTEKATTLKNSQNIDNIYSEIYKFKAGIYFTKHGFKSVKYINDLLYLISTNNIMIEGGEKISTPYRIITTAIDSTGGLWCGGPQGLNFYTKNGAIKSIRKIKEKYPITSKSILDLVYIKNVLWVATESNGLYLWNGNKIIESSVLNNTIVYKLQSYGDYIYASTNFGIYQLAYNSKIESIEILEIYNTKFGLENNSIGAFCVFNDKIYIGADNCFYEIPLKNETDTISSKKILEVSNFTIGDITVPNDTRFIKVTYKQNYFKINFYDLNLYDADQSHYKYFIEGLDDTWHSSLNNSLQIYNLDPGNYTIRFQSTDIRGNVTELAKNIRIEIKPFWLFSKSSKIIISIGLLSILILYFLNTVRQIKLTTDKEIQFNKKIANLKLEALQNQMNPHFVFNCLNSIQNLILSKNWSDANSSLQKFSKLIRAILETSYKKSTTVQNEIEFLKLYFELEKLRFGDNFHFYILIDSNFDRNIEIPAMLIQPFVDNAIHHGISPKKEGGSVTVAFELLNNLLLITIKDDGIGRAASLQNKALRVEKHISRGLQLTNDLVNSWNYEFNLSISYKIEDNCDQDNKCTGTTVLISIEHII